MNDLAYFISLMEKDDEHSSCLAPETAPKLWDHRARSWAHERKNNRKTDERREKDFLFLEKNGLLKKEFSVADIGCGPGRFAAAFASRVRFVTALDLSGEMIAQGREYAKCLGLSNLQFHICDFDALDLKKEGFEKAFDLVFCSLTPAVRSCSHLLKAMEMSRGHCCCISHLYRKNRLMEQIMREVFPEKNMRHENNGCWFYAAFNVLFLMGYRPETSYETRHSEKQIIPDDEYLDFLMEKMLLPDDRTAAARNAVMTWLTAHTGTDGTIKEVTDSCYGRLLWEVTKQ